MTITFNPFTGNFDFTGSSVADHGELDGLADDDHTQYTTAAEATTIAEAVAAAVVDAAPGTLDTLNELAAALGDDANFATTVTTALADKASTSDLTTHAADTTSVHGIADTSVLATASSVATAVSNHEADTTSVHGITDTTLLITGVGAGTESVKVGANAVASQNQSIALGNGQNATAAPQATAQGAIAIGGSNGAAINGARASGNNSVAIGSGDAAQVGAVASGAQAVALGYLASAAGTGAVALGGLNPSAAATGSIAIGSGARANTGTQTIAIGAGTNSTAAPNATGQGSIAIGASNGSGVNGARASAIAAVAIGSGDASSAGASSSGVAGVSIGYKAICSADQTVGIGHTALASATNGVAVGCLTQATNAQAVAIGSVARATTGNGAIAIGGGTNTTSGPFANAQGAIAIGGSNGSGVNGARASAASAIAIGSGDASVASAAATAADAIAIGRQSAAAHATAIALGKGATTTAINQIMLGTSSETVVVPGTLNVGGSNAITGAWTAWTPAISNGTWAIGNGTVSGRYARVGRIVHFTMMFTYGSTSVKDDANAIYLSLPVAADTTHVTINSTVRWTDASGIGWYAGAASLVTSTTFRCVIFENATPFIIGNYLDGNNPTAWGTGDVLSVAGTYEAAA